MKLIFILVALLAFSSVSLAASAPPPSASLVGNADSVTIPIQIVNGIIYMQATVNEKKARFVLDSGAEIAFLNTEFARKLGLDSGRKEASISGTGGDVRASLTTLRTLKVGGARLKNMGAGVISFPQALQADGVLGYDFFRPFVVTINYEHKRLTLTKPSAFHPIGPGIALEITRMPDVAAEIDGHKARMTIDTGDGGDVTLNAPFVARERLREAYAPRYEIPTGIGIGGMTYATVTRAKELTFGGFVMPGPIVEMSSQKTGAETEIDDDGTIGSEILSRFTVTLDYGRKKLYLTPNQSIAAPFVYSRSGVSTNDRMTVVSVIPGSSGDTAGVKVGDEVLSVNGIAAAKISIIKPLMRGAVGTSVKLTLRRGMGKPFKVVLILCDIL